MFPVAVWPIFFAELPSELITTEVTLQQKAFRLLPHYKKKYKHLQCSARAYCLSIARLATLNSDLLQFLA